MGCMFYARENEEAAASCWQLAVSRNQEFAAAHRALAQVLFEAYDDISGAKRELERAFACCRDARIFYEKYQLEKVTGASGKELLRLLEDNADLVERRQDLTLQYIEQLSRAGRLEEAKALLDDVLLPAINEVGELFDQGRYFLPQLIASAEAMKASIEYLEPLLAQKQSGREMPVVVIATVEGDIHDIGKNLVALMLKNYGFKVVDLGKDVSKEKIIEAAKQYHAQVIALSALMTTTMQQMKHVIDHAREQQVDAKIIVGGAVITQEYADEIGADGYSRDAAEAVKLTKRILQIDV